MSNLKQHSKRIAIGILGGIVMLLGLVMVPYPGPGWLVVFAGLAILATEFDWAQRLLHKARGIYDAWQGWLAAQPAPVRSIFWVLTCLVVITTIWLLNGYGIINELFNLGWSWVKSPLF